MLRFPDSEGLRPTPDRVRETLFNWLGQELDGWHCLDLFAGSGALGFEAASRGASPVLLIAGSRTREPAARIVDLLAGVMPDARVQRLDGGDHLEALVSPARIISRIAEFLADVDVARASRWAEAA